MTCLFKLAKFNRDTFGNMQDTSPRGLEMPSPGLCLCYELGALAESV